MLVLPKQIRANAFRILALPVTASEREIIARVDELRTFARIGKAASFPRDALAPGPIPRDTASLDATVQELHNPLLRLNHVAFWFLDKDDTDHSAIDLLLAGDVHGAVHLWRPGWNRRLRDCHFSHVKNYALLTLLGMCEENQTAKEARTWAEGAVEAWDFLLGSTALLMSVRKHVGVDADQVTESDMPKIVAPCIKEACNNRWQYIYAFVFAKSRYLAGVVSEPASVPECRVEQTPQRRPDPQPERPADPRPAQTRQSRLRPKFRRMVRHYSLAWVVLGAVVLCWIGNDSDRADSDTNQQSPAERPMTQFDRTALQPVTPDIADETELAAQHDDRMDELLAKLDALDERIDDLDEDTPQEDLDDVSDEYDDVADEIAQEDEDFGDAVGDE
jgi:hypothetical protein